MLGKGPDVGRREVDLLQQAPLDRAGVLLTEKESPLLLKLTPRPADSKLRENTDVAMWANGQLSRMSNACGALFA